MIRSGQLVCVVGKEIASVPDLRSQLEIQPESCLPEQQYCDSEKTWQVRAVGAEQYHGKTVPTALAWAFHCHDVAPASTGSVQRSCAKFSSPFPLL